MASSQPSRFPLSGEAARSLFADVNLVLADGVKLSCHKAVLSSHSSVFYSLFESCASLPGGALAFLEPCLVLLLTRTALDTLCVQKRW